MEMASTESSALVIRGQSKDITECCLCNDTYKGPRILPCIHTLCLKCLEEVGGKTSKGPGYRMPCPVCRKEFMIPEEGYAAIQRNFFVEELIEMAKIASLSGGSDRCEACMKEKSEATSISEVPLADMYCTDCKQKMCQECSTHHRKNKLTRSHRIIAVVDSQSKAQIPRPSICVQHQKEHGLYCSDCKQFLCTSCFSESHQNHRLQNVGNAVEGLKNEIKGSLSSLEVCESQVLEKKVILNRDIMKYCEYLEGLKLEVLLQKYAAIKLVSDHAELIMQNIDQLKAQKRNEVQAEIEDTGRFLIWLESFKVYCAEIMAKGSGSDICCAVDRLKAVQDIKERIESEIKIKTNLHRPKMSFQVSDLEEFVKREDYNVIGAIRECQAEVEGQGETRTGSGDIKIDEYRMPASGSNGILTKINRLKQELEIERCRISDLEIENKASEKRINELNLELGIKRLRKSVSGLPLAQATAATRPFCIDVSPPRIVIDCPNLATTLCTER